MKVLLTFSSKTLLETGLPSFYTVCANASFNFRSRWSHCNNSMLRACSSY